MELHSSLSSDACPTSPQRTLDYADAVSDWLIQQGQMSLAQGDLNGAMSLCYAAACVLTRQNRTLASSQLESVLQDVGRLVARSTHASWDGADNGTCLHILTEALPAGGLTAMAIRWIANDSRGGRTHSVALLAQSAPIPPQLEEAVAASGGRIHVCPPRRTLIEQAKWLREIAWRSARHVVLHVDVSDVVCPVAFGTPGGPPVLLVNHSAHVFWTGCSTVDAVANCRGSDLEALWALKYRGASKCVTVPIPLPEAESALGVIERQSARQTLGVTADAVVLLTVGAGFKFKPLNGLSFVDACRRILERIPNAILIGVGFAPDEHWRLAAHDLGSRVRILGPLSRAGLASWRVASDIYVEGFPFGTTTALLEAALGGLPVVLAPNSCPPPYGTDGVAIDELLQRPATVEDLVETVCRLALDPRLREREGTAIKASVEKHHTGSGWNGHLASALADLPPQHAVRPSLAVERTPASIHEYWTNFVSRWGSGYDSILEMAVAEALAAGRRPRLSRSVLKASLSRQSTSDRAVPPTVIWVFCNYASQVLPRPVAGPAFRLVCFLCRPALFRRLRSKFTPRADRLGWYDEYRQMPR